MTRLRPTLLAALFLSAASLPAQTVNPATVQADPRVARADSLFLAQDFRAAAAQYATAMAAMTLDPRSLYRYGMALTNLNEFAKAADMLDESAKAHNPVVLFAAGSVHGRLGHADKAFDYLDQSMARGFSNQALFVDDPGFLAVRSDPRYAAALQKMKDAFTPCARRPESHQFDFWVGEWNVIGAGGQQAGTSSVQKILGDCVVFENWTDGQGGQGKSLNAYNAGLSRWQQFWTDQYGQVTEYRESEWVGPSLQYTASAFTRQGQAVLQRMTFTPIDSATVRQFGQTSTDGGKTWTTGYDLFYHRKK